MKMITGAGEVFGLLEFGHVLKLAVKGKATAVVFTDDFPCSRWVLGQEHTPVGTDVGKAFNIVVCLREQQRLIKVIFQQPDRAKVFRAREEALLIAKTLPASCEYFFFCGFPVNWACIEIRRKGFGAFDVRINRIH